MSNRQWFNPSKPEEIEPIPWLHTDVIQYLENIIQPDFEVLEFGAGGSTLWFAERVREIISVENREEWRQEVNKRLTGSNIAIKTIGNIFPFGEYRRFDLLFIDGEPVGERATWIMTAPKLVKSGGWVVLDNANRREYEKEREWLKGQAAFCESIDRNTNPSVHFLVTDFYRMP